MTAALSDHPDDPDLWAFLAGAHAHLWHLDEAVQCMQEAVRLASTTRHRYGFLLGEIPLLLKAGRPREALGVAGEAHELQPQFPEAYIYEGRARLLLRDFVGAIASIDAALARMRSVDTLVQRQYVGSLGNPIQLYECEPFCVRAEAHGQLGNFDDAIADVDRALAAAPPLYIERYLRQVRGALAMRERPPFFGDSIEAIMVATRRLIQKIASYPSAEAALADLADESSELVRLATAADADTELAAEYAEAHFAEEVA